MPEKHTIPTRVAIAILAAATLAAPTLPAAPAAAQSGKPPGAESGEPQAPRRRPDGQQPKAGEAMPDHAPTRKSRPTSKSPQTSEEKAKLLSDLYAQLATAEDEAAAKKFSGAIERLWMHSGSDTITLLMERAASAMKEKRNDLARQLLDHVVSLAPDYPEGFNQRAYFHFSQNDFDSAVGDLRRVLALEPNHYKALEGLAQIWRESGNKKGAYGVLRTLIEVHPFSPGAKAAFDELRREVEGQGI